MIKQQITPAQQLSDLLAGLGQEERGVIVRRLARLGLEPRVAAAHRATLLAALDDRPGEPALQAGQRLLERIDYPSGDAGAFAYAAAWRAITLSLRPSKLYQGFGWAIANAVAISRAARPGRPGPEYWGRLDEQYVALHALIVAWQAEAAR